MSFNQDFLDRFYTRLSQTYAANDPRQSGYQFSWWLRRISVIVERQLKTHNIDLSLVIDLGCGSGLFLEQVFLENQNLIGVDYNESACLRASRRGIDAVRADIFKLPFKDCSATTVCCINVIQQFECDAVADLLTAASNLLKPKGILVLVWRNNNSLLHKIAKLSFRLTAKTNRHPTWYGHSAQAIAKHLHSTGFHVESTRFLAPIINNSFSIKSAFGDLFGTEFFVLAVKS